MQMSLIRIGGLSADFHVQVDGDQAVFVSQSEWTVSSLQSCGGVKDTEIHWMM